MSDCAVFDFIIIGGGSAGCVMAARLSENPKNQILLLEAGGNNDDLLIKMPAGIGEILPHANKYNWGFYTQKQKQLYNRALYWPRGRGLGGSSAINAMIYTRGHPIDYDDWARLGLKNWSYKDLLPYFKKAEGFLGVANEYHGTSGPLKVSVPNSQHIGFDKFAQATKSAGFEQNSDFNGASNLGFGKYQLTIANGERCSAYAAYIKPILKRPNLQILTEKTICRIIIEGKKAVGVEYFDQRSKIKKIVKANNEIHLCAGAIGSPQILLLSGIGPQDELIANGIKPIINSQSVGRNLQDHLDISILQKYNRPLTYYSLSKGLNKLKIGMQYIISKTGYGAQNFLEFGGFAKTDEGLFRPNLQFHFMNGMFKDHNQTPIKHDGFTLHVCNLYPESRGSISLRGADFNLPPKIDPNYLATEKDLEIMIKGLKIARQILAQPAFNDSEEFEPSDLVQNDAAIEDYIRGHCETIYHPIGTCRMGIDEESVVDEQLRVRGINGLRVIDASIMPRIIGGNTNAPTIAIAEYAADMVCNKI